MRVLSVVGRVWLSEMSYVLLMELRQRFTQTWADVVENKASVGGGHCLPQALSASWSQENGFSY